MQKIATRVPPSLCDVTLASHPSDLTFEPIVCAAGVDSSRPNNLAQESQVRFDCGGPHISQKYDFRDYRSGSGGFSKYFGDFYPLLERRYELRFKDSAVAI
jgi:hypothetical protein